MPFITREHLEAVLAAIPSRRILVLGDIIVDHFIWGAVTRISPEAPVPVVNVTRESLLLGGSANVLNNIHSLGGQATICGLVGDDAMGEHLIGLLRQMGSDPQGVIRAADRPTTIKTRVIAQHQQVVRFDREKTTDVTGEHLERVKRYLTEHLAGFDAVIVSDYAKGIINDQVMDHLRATVAARSRRIPIIVDPKPARPERFRDASVITPNHHEAAKMSGIEIVDEATLEVAGRSLQKNLNSDAVLITRGEAGMTLFERDLPMLTIPTVAKDVFDVTGAGDTVIATLALGLTGGLSYAEAADLANHAAGIVVGKLGTATASAQELRGAIR